MKDIAIFGAGGLGREVACLIKRINESLFEPKWSIIGFFDDGKPKGTSISHFGNVLGGIEEINAFKEPLDLALAIANPSVTKRIATSITNNQIYYPNLIDPTLLVVDPETFDIGYGNIIHRGCLFSCSVKIGNFNILNGKVTLGHDVTVGDFNAIMPSVNISGEVTIGDGNFFGVGSIVLQQLSVGNGVRLGAGSVMMTKPKDGCLYIGNPAKRFKY